MRGESNNRELTLSEIARNLRTSKGKRNFTTPRPSLVKTIKEQSLIKSISDLTPFQKWRQKYYQTHKKQIIKDSLIYNKKNIQRKRLNDKKYNAYRYLRIKLSLFNMLGGKCVHCGFNNFRALQLDHINNGGTKDFKRFGKVENMYRFYLKNPEIAKKTVQILCANCNWIKRDTVFKFSYLKVIDKPFIDYRKTMHKNKCIP